MEGLGLGLFMISAYIFGALLETLIPNFIYANKDLHSVGYLFIIIE